MDLCPETLIQCPRAFTYPIMNVSKAEVSRRVAEAIVNVNYSHISLIWTPSLVWTIALFSSLRAPFAIKTITKCS